MTDVKFPLGSLVMAGALAIAPEMRAKIRQAGSLPPGVVNIRPWDLKGKLGTAHGESPQLRAADRAPGV